MEVVYLIRAARIKIRERFDAFIFLSFFFSDGILTFDSFQLSEVI